MPNGDVQIRQAEPGDYIDLYEIFSCPNVFAGTLQLPYPSQEIWKQRLSNPEDGHHNLVAVIGDKVIGTVGIHTFPRKPRRRHVGTIGMAVHDNWQGKGIGTALMQAVIEFADNWLNLSRLELEVYTDNLPAIKLYEAFGFEREGLLRRHAFRGGTFVDSYVMARLRP